MDGETNSWTVAFISLSRALREASSSWSDLQRDPDFQPFTMGSRYLSGEPIWIFWNGFVVASWGTSSLGSFAVSNTGTPHD